MLSSCDMSDVQKYKIDPLTATDRYANVSVQVEFKLKIRVEKNQVEKSRWNELKHTVVTN